MLRGPGGRRTPDDHAAVFDGRIEMVKPARFIGLYLEPVTEQLFRLLSVPFLYDAVGSNFEALIESF
jgi:hypothetical protein